MGIKSWLINKLEKDVEKSAGHIELENLTAEDREELFKQFGEGDANLTKFLRQAYKSGLSSIFCCSGHGTQSAYVNLKVTDENIDIARKIGKILSKLGIVTNFIDDHIRGKYVDYRSMKTTSTEWLNTATQILSNPELFEDVEPDIYYHEEMYSSKKPFAFELKKRLLSYLRNTKQIAKASTTKRVDGNEKNEFLERLKGYTQDNQNARDNITFSQIKEALEILRSILKDSKDDIYISGGIVPYIIANQDSGRLHDDIDTICNIENISKLREILKQTDFYKPEWDSLNVSKDGNDYGFEIQIEGVPIGIYPFVYKDKQLTQYTYDPYTYQCKVKSFELQEISDYVQSYTSREGKTYNTMSLEYIKRSKDMVGRPKDIRDSRKIDELGLIRPDIIQRIKLPAKTNFADMEK